MHKCYGITACADLAELHVAGLALAQGPPLPPHPVTRDEEEAGADVLQLEPVKQLERGGSAGPVQHSPQLIDEGQPAENLQAQVAPGVHVTHEHKGMPATRPPAGTKSFATQRPLECRVYNRLNT